MMVAPTPSSTATATPIERCGTAPVWVRIRGERIVVFCFGISHHPSLSMLLFVFFHFCIFRSAFSISPMDEIYQDIKN